MAVTRAGGEERRALLISEAVRLFGARGFAAASLDEISEAAGVRKQTLLYHFASKEALFDSCVETLAMRLANSLEDVLEGEFDSPFARIEAIISSLFRLAEDWPEFPMFVREASWRGADVVQQMAGALEPLRKRALGYLERGMHDGDFRRQDPALLLFTLYTAVVGSLTEAGVLRAVVGGKTGADALKRREAELIAFVRGALAP